MGLISVHIRLLTVPITQEGASNSMTHVCGSKRRRRRRREEESSCTKSGVAVHFFPLD